MNELMVAYFHKHVDRSGAEGSCWLWTGSLNRQGYGIYFQYKPRRDIRAHRISWEIFVGEIPSGLDVCHKCDVPACVNPHHLFLGTHAQNMADMAKKLRSGRAKLNGETVREIRRLSNEGISGRKIAVRVGMEKTAIQNILRGETWKHIK